jgi:LmbE family N-acetylglucosaminyl deacetylase
VLLVEDDELLAAVLLELAGSLGEAFWAPSAEQALDVLDSEDWDLLVTDIELPGIDGLELARLVRRSHPPIAVLVLTAHSSVEYAVQALRADADDFMAKPVDAQTLLSKLAELIALARARKAAQREVVLAIGAHPDDVEIGCGGILLRHAARGDGVNVLTLSGGEAGGETAERARESERAARLMSARLFHTGLQDTSIGEGAGTIATIERTIAEVAPRTIYTHTSHDVHQDHRNAHRATLVAAREVPRIYCYEAPSSTVDFHPTRFVPVDDFLEAKLEAIAAYASQVALRRYLDEDLLRATARYWSRFGHSRYAEPLEVLRESEVDPLVAEGSAHAPAAEVQVEVEVPADVP